MAVRSGVAHGLFLGGRVKITVIAVGKLKNAAVTELVAEYGKRVNKWARLEWIEVKAEPGKTPADKALPTEAARIRARIPERAFTAALCERGEERDSEGFARLLGELADGGRDVCFLIGGARGLDGALVKEAHARISLSRLTLPHELCRAVLAEQVYRAFTISRGEPYHK